MSFLKFGLPSGPRDTRLHLRANRSCQPQLLKSLSRNMRRIVAGQKAALCRPQVSASRRTVFVTFGI
jgi:hypothetical protein